MEDKETPEKMNEKMDDMDSESDSDEELDELTTDIATSIPETEAGPVPVTDANMKKNEENDSENTEEPMNKIRLPSLKMLPCVREERTPELDLTLPEKLDILLPTADTKMDAPREDKKALGKNTNVGLNLYLYPPRLRHMTPAARMALLGWDSNTSVMVYRQAPKDAPFFPTRDEEGGGEGDEDEDGENDEGLEVFGDGEEMLMQLIGPVPPMQTNFAPVVVPNVPMDHETEFWADILASYDSNDDAGEIIAYMPMQEDAGEETELNNLPQPTIQQEVEPTGTAMEELHQVSEIPMPIPPVISNLDQEPNPMSTVGGGNGERTTDDEDLEVLIFNMDLSDMNDFD